MTKCDFMTKRLNIPGSEIPIQLACKECGVTFLAKPAGDLIKCFYCDSVNVEITDDQPFDNVNRPSHY